MKSFINDLLSVFKSRVAVIIFGLGGNIITARFLGPQANGVIAALMVYPSLFMTFGSLGIQQSTTYFVGKNKYNTEQVYGAVLVICIFTSIFCVSSCYLLIHFFTKGNYSNTLIILAICGLPFSLYNTYTAGIFLGKQNIKEYNKINWVPAAFNLFFTFLFVVVFTFGVAGSMFGTFLGVFLFSFFLFFKVRKMIDIKPSFNFTIIKNMIGLGSIYALSYLISFLNYRVDIILLERLSTSYEIGIYSKGAVLVEYMWSIPLLLSTIIFSKSANAQNPKEFSLKVCTLLRFAGLITFIGLILLYFISHFIILSLYGSSFVKSALVLQILMPGVLLLTIFRVLNQDISGRGKPWIAIKAMLPAVVINIILNYLWIPKYGANGSAFASTVSYSFAAIIFLIIYSREVEIPILIILAFSKDDKVLVYAQYTRILNRFKKTNSLK